MGYDMTTVTKDPDEEKAVEEIRARMAAGHEDHGALYVELRKTERSYFRLNIWGMGVARELMHGAGMLDLERPAEAAQFPDPNDFNVTSEMWDGWDGEADESTPEPLRNYYAAVEAVVAFQREVPTGIPVHKLGSNDDWLVTPAEIGAALERYVLGDGVPADAPGWWADWIEWLRYAQDHGGFRVR